MLNTVISVENINKSYQLGTIGTGTFTNDIKVWWAKRRGKPNPLTKIGEIDYGNQDGETLWALKDISFTVQQGEALGIIGRNGAGKSTLLKILSRVTTPTSGAIKIKGRIASLLEVGTGFHPELTGRENIALNGAILGMTRAEVRRKFDEIVDFSGVEQFIDTPVKRYSSGMYVRLAFAVAAHLEPEILIVDEVLAVGDAEFQKKCLGKMSDVAQEGRTVLFVSHNMSAVKVLCTKGILIEKGKLIQYGSIGSVVETYLSSTDKIRSNNVDVSKLERPSRCTLRARIIGISVTVGEKINPDHLDSKESFTVRLIVESFDSSIIHCSAQIMVNDESQPLSLLDSAALHKKIYLLNKGISYIDCELSHMNLYGGKYKISCGLVVPGTEVIDHIDEAYIFEVDEYDPYNSGYNLQKSYGFGIFQIDHQWKDLIEAK